MLCFENGATQSVSADIRLACVSPDRPNAMLLEALLTPTLSRPNFNIRPATAVYWWPPLVLGLTQTLGIGRLK